MSGGHFNGGEFQLTEIIRELEDLLEKQGKYSHTTDPYSYWSVTKQETVHVDSMDVHYRSMSDETAINTRILIALLKLAYAGVHGFDFMWCSDTGEDTFNKDFAVGESPRYNDVLDDDIKLITDYAAKLVVNRTKS